MLPRLGFLFLLMLLSSVSYAFDMQMLSGKMSAVASRKALFTESRQSEFLNKPLVSKGELEFRAPGTMIKKISEPEKIEQRIEGDELMIVARGKIKDRISLSSYPDLALGINALRWILSGDMQSLQQEFYVSLTGELADWRMELSPKSSGVVSSIVIQGHQQLVKTINISQSNGDSTKTELYEHQ